MLNGHQGLIAIIVEGTRRIGGPDIIWERAKQTDRLELFE